MPRGTCPPIPTPPPLETGRPALPIRLQRALVDQVLAAAVVDIPVATAFNEVAFMNAPPSTLAAPWVVLRSVASNVRTRAQAMRRRLTSEVGGAVVRRARQPTTVSTGRWSRKALSRVRVRNVMSWNDDVIAAFRNSKGTENYWGPKLIILHSIGAKSGETHLNPVVGFRNERGWRVVASKGGSPENPAWYHNLRANPSFEIEALVDGEIVTVPVTATEIAADEWREAYDAISAEEPQFAGYLEKTDRRIPVLQLTPRPVRQPR